MISATSRKAISHAENLSAYGTLAAADTVAMRQTEVSASRKYAVEMLISMER